MMSKLSFLLVLVCAGAARPAGLHGAELGLPDRKLDFHVRKIVASRLFEAMAEITKRHILIDECVDKVTIDLTIKNAPVPLVFDAVASQGRFEYQLEGKAIRIRCVAETTASAPDVPKAPNAPVPRDLLERSDLREALQRAFPHANQFEIDEAILALEERLRHD
jgi:hypothetical protein